MTSTYKTSEKFSMIRDINGYNGFGLPFTKDNYSATLAQNTATPMTVPDNGIFKNWLAIFSYQDGATVWVTNNFTATAPSSSSFSISHSQLKPIARKVEPGDILSFLTTDTASQVEVSFYGLD